MGKIYQGFMRMIARCIFRKPEFVYEEPPKEGEAVVFTANHSQADGPAITTLYFPQPLRPWSIAQVLDKKTSAGFIYHDEFAGEHRKHKWFWKMLAYPTSWLLRPLLLAVGCIPVYHDRRVSQTLDISLDALTGGSSLMIFPECPEPFSEHVNDFYGGFVKIGELYYKKTGKNLKFYPCYIVKSLRKVLVGKPIEYTPDVRGSSARKQFAESLRDKTEQLALSLPPHKVPPFMTKEWYEAYGHYWTENRMLEYWNLSQTDLENRKRKKSKKTDSKPKDSDV